MPKKSLKNLVASADQLVQRVWADLELLLEADGHHGSLEEMLEITGCCDECSLLAFMPSRDQLLWD